jgi:hypothetical protein
MAYDDKPVSRSDKAGSVRKEEYGYNECIDRAKAARNSQLKDSDPMVEKEGFLGVDDLDKMRRRKIR